MDVPMAAVFGVVSTLAAAIVVLWHQVVKLQGENTNLLKETSQLLGAVQVVLQEVRDQLKASTDAVNACVSQSNARRDRTG